MGAVHTFPMPWLAGTRGKATRCWCSRQRSVGAGGGAVRPEHGYRTDAGGGDPADPAFGHLRHSFHDAAVAASSTNGIAGRFPARRDSPARPILRPHLGNCDVRATSPGFLGAGVPTRRRRFLPGGRWRRLDGKGIQRVRRRPVDRLARPRYTAAGTASHSSRLCRRS
jgi:hypothetical protein